MNGQIPKAQWSDYFTDFAKLHEDYEAQIEVVGRVFGDQDEVDWMPLAGISYDRHHQQLFITVGGTSSRFPAHLTHTIDSPRIITVHNTSEGNVGSIIIVAPDKSETRVRLRRSSATAV